MRRRYAVCAPAGTLAAMHTLLAILFALLVAVSGFSAYAVLYWLFRDRD